MALCCATLAKITSNIYALKHDFVLHAYQKNAIVCDMRVQLSMFSPSRPASCYLPPPAAVANHIRLILQ
jgi:hypothetical protein